MDRKKKRVARRGKRKFKNKKVTYTKNTSFVFRVLIEIPLVYLNFLIFLFESFKKISFTTSKKTKAYNNRVTKRLNSKTTRLTKRFKKLEKKYKKRLIIAEKRYRKEFTFETLKNKFVCFTYLLKHKLLALLRVLQSFLKRTKLQIVTIYIATTKYISLKLTDITNSIRDTRKKLRREKPVVIVGENKPVIEQKESRPNNVTKILYVVFYPFIIVYRIIRAIFSFEIRFRLFSFRTLVLIFLMFTFYIISVFYLAVLKDIPSPDNISQQDTRLTTRIYDRKGNLLYRVYDNEDRTLVEMKDIPEQLIAATLAIEDASFYEHNGLSPKGIARAAKKTYIEDDTEGGSTITQQLVKNTLLSPERTMERKIKEAIIAIEVERRFSKNEILEMYLNRISYGGTAHGVKAAAKKYFGKELGELTLAESSFLAGLPAAPSTYSPFSTNPEFGKKRQADVLRRLVEIGYITPEVAENTFKEKLVFNDQSEYIIAPHFVNYVINDLESKYGQQLIAQGGLDIYTSLDIELQRKLENVVERNVFELARNNVSNGAVVVINPKTGEVLAMVGSANYWDTENDGNVNVTVSPRQPGSSIKPITYALALENGYTPTSMIDDSPVTYQIAGQKGYSPRNYDNRFHGNVTLASALANSYNIPAVKLLNSLGVDNYIEFAEKLGITTWTDRSRYGLSLTLGAGEVRMIDMAEAYGAFANLGYKKDVNPILKIYDPLGNVLEENTCVDFLKESPSILTRKTLFEVSANASTREDTGYDYEGIKCPKEKVLSESTAFQIGQMLSNNAARTPAFGANSALNITEKQVAVKTGTTSSLKDNWAIGFTNDYVVVSWIGNNDGEPMKDVVSGYRGASNIWRETFDYILKTKDVESKLAIPSNMIEVEICPLTNTLACTGCNNVKQYFLKGEEPKVACDPAVVRKILNDRKKQEEERKAREEEKKNEDD